MLTLANGLPNMWFTMKSGLMSSQIFTNSLPDYILLYDLQPAGRTSEENGHHVSMVCCMMSCTKCHFDQCAQILKNDEYLVILHI